MNPIVGVIDGFDGRFSKGGRPFLARAARVIGIAAGVCISGLWHFRKRWNARLRM
jgi:hypothetical protein